MTRNHLLVLVALVAGLWTSCRKDQFINSPDARLSTSADSLLFDTVFSSTGSITKFFRIYNLNNQKLRISQVRLGGGSQSAFRINVDGITGPEVNNLELDANDSLYVFVTAKLDPGNSQLPFVVEDSILIDFNGNEAKVQLQAWGQNAHFLRNSLIASDQTWTNDLPYVILGGLLVDSNASLTIERGCRVYFHADAPFVVDGHLQVLGGVADSDRVVFRGDRLDDPYRDFPGSWPGIYFRSSSSNNLISYAHILNAYQGLAASGPVSGGQPQLVLRSCVIDNCYDAGIIALNSDIQAENCLISNCGKNMVLAYGGQYDFLHCTSAAYSNPYLSHKDPVLQVTDFAKDGANIYSAPLNAQFRNCIFWGDNGTVDNEVVTSRAGNLAFNCSFDHCLWKVNTTPADVQAGNMITNQPPLFDSINTQRRIFDFHLQQGSPALESGAASSLTRDLDGNPRPVGLPDIGCYERQ